MLVYPCFVVCCLLGFDVFALFFVGFWFICFVYGFIVSLQLLIVWFLYNLNKIILNYYYAWWELCVIVFCL